MIPKDSNFKREKQDNEKSSIDWNDVVFEVELLKSQEINLDFILELIFEKNKNTKNIQNIIGTAGADVIEGNNANNTFEGNDGIDIL